jgi:hypothetical protein
MFFTPFGPGKGIIFGLATERVSDSGPSLPVPVQVECPEGWSLHSSFGGYRDLAFIKMLRIFN